MNTITTTNPTAEILRSIMNANAETPVVTCDHCGQIIDDDETTYTTHDGQTICESCAEDDFTACDYCGELFHVDTGIVINPGEIWDEIVVCPDCVDTFNYCPNCGEYWDDDHFNFDAGTCEGCAPRVILPYHTGNPVGDVFKGETSMSYIPAYIGAEIEITYGDGRGDATPEQHAHASNVLESAAALGGYDALHFEEDCSVTGYECIFQARTIEYWHAHANEYRRIFRAMGADGAHAESGNGLHVHFSKSAFGGNPDEIAESVARLMLLFSGKNYARMVKLSGRDEHDARRWADDMNAETDTAETRKRRVTNAWDDHGVSVNTSPGKATVEIRLGRSTVDFETFIAWVDLLAVAVRRSREISDDDARDFNQWFINAPEHVREYMDAHGVPWRRPATVDRKRAVELLEQACNRIAQLARFTGATAPEIADVLRTIGAPDAEIDNMDV